MAVVDGYGHFLYVPLCVPCHQMQSLQVSLHFDRYVPEEPLPLLLLLLRRRYWNWEISILS